MLVEVKTPRRLEVPFCFAGPSGCFNYLVTGSDPIQIVVEVKDPELGKELNEQILSGEIGVILDSLSWILDTPIRDYTTDHRKISPTGSFVSLEKFLFNEQPTVKKYELISAYRQIQNEESPALRYLMYYRLLEVLAKELGCYGKIHRLLRDHDIPQPLVRSKTFMPWIAWPLISYIRNKIHATNESYRFPYSLLVNQEKNIRKITRTIIADRLIKSL